MNKLLLTAFILLSFFTYGEDIELYGAGAVSNSNSNPQVLIIMDTSGSMSAIQSIGPPYDPLIDYGALYGVEGNDHSLNPDFLYYTKGQYDGGGVPAPEKNHDTIRFKRYINGCESSKDALNDKGYWNGIIREYSFTGSNKKKGKWNKVPNNNGGNFSVIDCKSDWTDRKLGNGKTSDGVDFPDGYPVNNQKSGGDYVPYTTNIDKVNDNPVDWVGGRVTLYSVNYLLYWHAGEKIGRVDKSRMEMAKESIRDVIQTSSSIDFGLQVFNSNGLEDNDDNADDSQGGRIVYGVKNMTEISAADDTKTNKEELLELNATLNHGGWTPLCESLYEASLYFGGKPVTFGSTDTDHADQGHVANEPPMDYSITSLVGKPPNKVNTGSYGNYKTPFSGCNDKAYVILVSDGAPTRDKYADDTIKALKGVDRDKSEVTFTGQMALNKVGTAVSGNMLPPLAGWLHHFDVNDNLPGHQTIDTYTIGFSGDVKTGGEAEKVLSEAAKRGGGEYFHALDSKSLTSKLIQVLGSLDVGNQSFTSAGVSVNNFDRTKTSDSVYYSMFTPTSGSRWIGNLKKYKLVDGVPVGSKGNILIDKDGNFNPDARSFWPATDGTADGGEVTKGGVAAVLRKSRNFSSIYSDIATSAEDVSASRLVNLTLGSAKSFYTNSEKLALAFDVPFDSSNPDTSDGIIHEHIKFIKGIDVDDNANDGDEGIDIPVDFDKRSAKDIRFDVFGDPLHSKPLIINYGSDEGANKDVRVLVGTNSGSLHMFKDETSKVSESWSFIPREFFKHIGDLRKNSGGSSKIYGVDGELVSHIVDHNGDGIVNGTDKVWLFFGLRRGGSSYYALDITDPDNAPILKWRKDSSSTDLASLGLGQSWAKPVVGYSLLNSTKPVLFIGGGYATSKDANGVGTDDSEGNAVYMLDADSGKLLWGKKIGKDSIAAPVAILDSTGDGFVDRLYAGDTGGNVWRVDMPGKLTTDWSSFKFAQLGTKDPSDKANDRRFFYAPTIVRTFITETKATTADNITTYSHEQVPYDAILISSGDRTSPLNTDVSDMLFMLKDRNIKTQKYPGPDGVPAIPDAFTIAKLKALDTDLYAAAGGDQAKQNKVRADISSHKGWRIKLVAAGEKGVGSAIVLNGVAYFGSFAPIAPAVNSCDAGSGISYLYAVDLALGTQVYFNVEGESPGDTDLAVKEADARIFIPPKGQLGTTPTMVIMNKQIVILPTLGAKLETDFNLQTQRTYLYVTEE